MTECNIVVINTGKKKRVSALYSLLLKNMLVLRSFRGASNVPRMTHIIDKTAEIRFDVIANPDFSYVSRIKC